MRATRAAGLALSTGTYAPPAFSTAISAAIVHGRLRGEHAHPVAGLAALLDEGVREPVGGRLQLAVGHHLVAEHQGGRLGRTLGGAGEVVLQPVDPGSAHATTSLRPAPA